MVTVKHAGLKKWVNQMAGLCQPNNVVWLDGSESERKRLEKEALKSGELLELNQKKLPGCFLHRSSPNDVARTEHLTFICTKEKKTAGPNNNWMAPKEAYQKARSIYRGAMKGRTMYVIAFSMGLPESPFSKTGIQLTDSLYVALNMRIMTHTGAKILKKLGRYGSFTKCLHSKADLEINHRLILHFPEANTIWSVGSGYGGNALLGKKCLALRIASFLGQKEMWMAEHMLIMGIQDPTGQVTYVAAAFPSACGKTNLAMLVPPPAFKKKGYKIWTIGDDIAWLRIDEEGHLRAINPEAGMFGVVPGTNSQSNPNAVQAIKKNTIYTNVLLKKDKTVWWEGGDEDPPEEGGIDWQGRPWTPQMTDEGGHPVLGAHPNSRFTAAIKQCPSFSKEYYNSKGVKISAIIFGGRRSTVEPLVYEAKSWPHGVLVGATITSERTAAQMGKIGNLRNDPMAMLPFCGYNMGDYFNHWLRIGKNLSNPPKIFHVNWFRKNQDGQYIWPGFGDNLRVLLWMIRRCRYQVAAKDTPIGYVPQEGDIDLSGLNVSKSDWTELFRVNPSTWREEYERQKRFLSQFEDRLPDELKRQHEALGQCLQSTNGLPPQPAESVPVKETVS